MALRLLTEFICMIVGAPPEVGKMIGAALKQSPETIALLKEAMGKTQASPQTRLLGGRPAPGGLRQGPAL